MIYKDCIHYEACKNIYYPISTYDEEAKAFDESNSCDGCQFYSDTSRFIELLRWRCGVMATCRDCKNYEDCSANQKIKIEVVLGEPIAKPCDYVEKICRRYVPKERGGEK